MNRSNHKCTCHAKAGHEAIDTEMAIRYLNQKIERLANTLEEYMNDAALDRPTRNERAMKLVDQTTRIVGGKPTTDVA
jgi:excinuclease UvrABC nuclease subunit